MRPFLTIPILETTFAKCVEQVRSLPEEVQAYEIWLDALKASELTEEKVELSIRDLRAFSTRKCVVVCKDPMEKGKWKGTAAQKRRLLLAAARGGAHYIDMGLHSGKAEIQKCVALKGKSKLIISWHDFEKTPSMKRLETLSEKMMNFGADIVKIASFAQDATACDRLIHLAQNLQMRKQPHIVLGMGEMGLSTRIFAKKLGNMLNFVTLNHQTAPGQFTLQQMLQIQKVLKK